MKRHLATLLLALPFVVAMAPAMAESPRTIEVTLSRYSFSPQRIQVKRGEKVRLNVVSVEGTHGFHVKELGLDASIPDDGTPVRFDIMPTEAGIFEIRCTEYCGRGHKMMRAQLVVSSGE